MRFGANALMPESAYMYHTCISAESRALSKRGFKKTFM